MNTKHYRNPMKQKKSKKNYKRLLSRTLIINIINNIIIFPFSEQALFELVRITKRLL